ncbi:MAG: SDR family oxidoreductase [Treponema sp.]
MKHFTGKTMLITGGASGIGRSVAEHFARMGCTVIVWDVNQRNLQLLQEDAEQAHLPVIGMYCDITDRNQVYTRAKEVEETFGTLDILMNNAGVVTGKSLLEASDDDILLTMNVNTMALFWTVRAFLPAMMKKGRGHLVTLASAAGLIGVKGLVDYSASKFAAVGFNESVRMELADTCPGIKTTVICPYFIDTGMFAGVQTRFPLLLPILRQEYAVKRIVKAIITEKPLLVMPPFAKTLFLIRLFPVRLFDAIAGFFGINHSMDHFTGRAKNKP